MENYYEILEVSKNASQEVIEKAYKVLAKKYHPDMNEEENKIWAGEKFKKINEAYEILSNEDKKKIYDTELEANEEENTEKYNSLLQEIEILKNRLAYYEAEENKQNTQYNNISNSVNNGYQNNSNAQTYSNYNTQNKHFNRYYYKRENIFLTYLKNVFAIALAVTIIIAIMVILWLIPPTRDWMQNIYQENPSL